MTEFLFRGASFIHESIEDMMQNTKRVKGKKYGKSKQTARRSIPPSIVPNTMVGEEERADEELADVLSSLENTINKTDAIHLMGLTGGADVPFDTQVVVCRYCRKRMLAGALPIHNHEAHSAQIEMLKEEI